MYFFLSVSDYVWFLLYFCFIVLKQVGMPYEGYLCAESAIILANFVVIDINCYQRMGANNVHRSK